MTKTQKADANYQDYRMEHDGEKFSKKVAKLASQYVDYTTAALDEKAAKSPEVQKFTKKLDNKTLKQLLRRVKTNAGLNAMERYPLFS